MTPELDPEYARLLAWAYRGEVSGEALFATLAERWESEGHAESMKTLAELERRMAFTLLPLLQRYSVDGGDDDRSRRTGHDNAVAISELGWDAFLAQFGPVTGEAIARYQQLRSIAPEPEPILDALVAHEEALQAFGAAESRGESAASLEAVRTVIESLRRSG
jgi:hypothetical protein